jgi:hypothetical protein
MGIVIIDRSLTFIAGKTYLVKWNGVDYVRVAYRYEDNNELIILGEDNDPFYVEYWGNNYTDIYANDNPTNVTLAIYEKIAYATEEWVEEKLKEHSGGNEHFRVEITRNSDGSYTADKTRTEAFNAYKGGSIVYCSVPVATGTRVDIPLKSCVFGLMRFEGVYSGKTVTVQYVYDDSVNPMVDNVIKVEEVTLVTGNVVRTVNGIKPNVLGDVTINIPDSGGNVENGEDGFSPIATVTQTETGAVISITDKDGTTTATIINGKDGKDGADGQPGKDGADGAPGEKGDRGDKGEPGEPGQKGDKGDTGANGQPGKDGYTPQKGIDYFDGQDGQDGSPGKDGVSPTVEVKKTGKVTTITITDVNGTKTATIHDGEDGASSGGNAVPVYYTTNDAQVEIMVFDPSEIETNGKTINVGDWIVTPSGKVYVVTFVEDYGIEANYDATLDPGSNSGGNVDLTGYAKEQWVRQNYQPKGDYALKSQIPTAINTALEQAKASGEFDGENGKDGVSVVSVTQTTTSTVDDGKNVITVTLSNGNVSTFRIKNGAKGGNGANATINGVNSLTLNTTGGITKSQSGNTMTIGASLTDILASGPIILKEGTGYHYGDTLPAAGTKGRLFFKKVN